MSQQRLYTPSWDLNWMYPSVVQNIDVDFKYSKNPKWNVSYRFPFNIRKNYWGGEFETLQEAMVKQSELMIEYFENKKSCRNREKKIKKHEEKIVKLKIGYSEDFI